MPFDATPVTVLTGFLGSGKTTLLNRLLREDHGRRFAVIENEYGESGVDGALLQSERNETIIELDNGCICCTVRGDLAKALGELVAQRERGEIRFDCVLIETTGLADPGPIIQTFLAETRLLEFYYLDGVLAVADTLHVVERLAHPEARAQVAYADRVLLSKCDVADDAQRSAAQQAVRAINPTAPLREADLNHSAMDTLCGLLFEVRGYQFDRVTFDGARFAPMADDAPTANPAVSPHTHGVVSISYRSALPLHPVGLDALFKALQDKYGDKLWRYKGFAYVAGIRQRVVIQGVQRLLNMSPASAWKPFEARESRLVFIGQDLDREVILRMLEKCEMAQQAVSR